MIYCELGHAHHERRTAHVSFEGLEFDMQVFDTSQYTPQQGYCPGNDIVSRILYESGHWEPRQTLLVLDYIRDGAVLDFGANVGWYALVLARLGHRAIAYEGHPEIAEVLTKNAEGLDVEARNRWVDGTETIDEGDIEFLKADVEGMEPDVVKACAKMFEEKRIRLAMLEISPVFNDRYPATIQWIEGCGYRAIDMGTKLPATLEGVAQTDYLFIRR